MAHELSEYVDDFGDTQHEYAGALRPAWHGLGETLDYLPNSSEMIEAAHLGWRVGLRDIQTSDGTLIEGFQATVRLDTGAPLGVVTDRYKPLQNSEAFKFLDSLISSQEMVYETAGALRGGKIVWALGRFPSIDYAAEGDALKRYALFQTSHDGKSSIRVTPTSIRVVCANTMRLALKSAGQSRIRHTGDMRLKLDEAHRYLSQLDAAFDDFRDEAQKLATRYFSPDTAKAYIQALYPEVDLEGRAKAQRERRVAAVRCTLRNERQQMKSIKGTWWALLNAVTETVDHTGAQRASRRNDRDRAETRFLNVVDGIGADFKDRALKLAVEMSA